MSSEPAVNENNSSAVSVELLAQRLVGWFEIQKHYVVALSGGVDSSVVAKAASMSGARARLVTAQSAAVSAIEIADVAQLCEQVELPHEFLSTQELTRAGYVENSASRCYFCKSELFAQIHARFPDHEILTGTNFDDLTDYRPGLKAAAENHVRSPLAELGLTKKDVRGLAALWQLHVADKPASPCLASRIAHGVRVTEERLEMIESAEAMLRGLGLADCRVRLHEGELARIEVRREDFDAVCQSRDTMTKHLRELGFRYVTLDLEPLRSGSQNAVYRIQVKQASASRTDV